MADSQHYATLADVAAASGFATPIYSVGPAASGAVYTTVEEAVTAAETDIDAGTATRALVLVSPGTYLEDVTITASGIHVTGLGGPSDVIIRSLTWSDASAVSITAFNASGTFTDLADGAYTTPPLIGGVENVTLFRDAAAAAWHDNADASLRLLGFDAAAGTFLNTRFIVSNCRILKANGAAAGQGGIHGCYGNQLEVENTLITGGCLFEQYAVKSFAGCQMIGTGVCKDSYDATATIPATAFAATQLLNCIVNSEVEVNGTTCDFDAVNSYLGSIDINSTGASASTCKACEVHGAIDNANLAATLAITGGYTSTAVSGAGAASVTITAQAVQSDVVPLTDNVNDLGTTAKRYAEAHIASIQAHLDATNTAKTTLTGDTLQVQGTKFDVAMTAPAADTAGFAFGIEASAGGVASAAAGGTGGAPTLTGGVGGAGTAALVAGAGGNVNLVGGSAGANNGGGGNNGGNVALKGGAATGAGTAGKVQVGLTNTSGIDVGTNVVSDTDNTDDLGTTALAFKAVHARTLVAHGDATDTIKTTVAATSITPTRDHTIAPTKSANDVAGVTETLRGGVAGDAVGAAGKIGGQATVAGGVGAAGTAGLVAGAGGAVAITGGAAGANGGFGGGVGGDVTLAGGAASGAARPGYVATTSGFKLLDIAKAGRAALGLTAGVGNGTMIFCTDAGPAGVAIPLWWDASGVGQWRDAAGNVVA